ncbi:4'-phosphopantetheinyl transferase superfamily protein [Paenibacillus sp. MER 180]|uniref:4'-phosphopantetheinyl transferase family protein n=1 Tax=Paenibacillus sp. MER 180 TaxID=2939570 RepID=UPI00203B1A8F|nr:4'-phosphopantetheinyl transferase family protein [Paenibacillus sp. MER 180]MCM3291530.1 4'-phosphopantetheinyl transferase superfamily protein [Paenibacillus sp. MER 180]
MSYASFGQRIDLRRDMVKLNAALSVVHIGNSEGEIELAERVLHPNESAYLWGMRFERRKKSYILGRYSAKRAVTELMPTLKYQSIFVESGVFGQPFLVLEQASNLQVSITHSGCVGAAIAFPESHPMGIDLEIINDDDKLGIMERHMTALERGFVDRVNCSYPLLVTLLWTSKEALSKVLRTGLTVSMELLEIQEVMECNGIIRCTYSQFPQYASNSYVLGHYVCTIVSPRNTEFDVNLASLQGIDSILSCSCHTKGMNT